MHNCLKALKETEVKGFRGAIPQVKSLLTDVSLLAESREDFAPNCLKAWDETEEKGFVARYLK